MILIGTLACQRCALRPVYLLGKIARTFSRVVTDHIIGSCDVIDGAVASQKMLSQPVTAVTESGLPGNDDILGEIQRDCNRVGHFAAVFFREHPA